MAFGPNFDNSKKNIITSDETQPLSSTPVRVRYSPFKKESVSLKAAV